MSKKEQLKRIEAKLDLLLERSGIPDIEIKGIGGGGIKDPKPPKDETSG